MIRKSLQIILICLVGFWLYRDFVNGSVHWRAGSHVYFRDKDPIVFWSSISLGICLIVGCVISLVKGKK